MYKGWIVLLVLTLGCTRIDANAGEENSPQSKELKVYSTGKGYTTVNRIVKTEEEWKKELTEQQFHVMRKKGTERAFTGEYWNNHDDGVYRCAGCGNELYSSQTKFESGTGWPSFFKPVAPENIKLESDNSYFMERTEVMCARCDAHLGHVFDDGPRPTGLRHCINSVSLKFEKKK